MSALVISTQQCTRYAIRDQKKKVVYILEEVKMSLFTDNMILYVANPKQSRYTHIPGLICLKGPGIQDKYKSIFFLYTNNNPKMKLRK